MNTLLIANLTPETRHLKPFYSPILQYSNTPILDYRLEKFHEHALLYVLKSSKIIGMPLIQRLLDIAGGDQVVHQFPGFIGFRQQFFHG